MPDHDTVLYNLAGIEQVEWGWGIEGDTHATMAQLGAYGEDDVVLARRPRPRAAHRADGAAARRRPADRGVPRAPGVARASRPGSCRWPTSRCGPRCRTDEGWLEFQEYFVHRRQAPDVHEIRFAGVEAARPTPEVLAALDGADAIVICPSNPLVSVGPILAVPGMREAHRRGPIARRARSSP